ncbi:MAG TPA: cupin domain-containing protein [Chloroflexota bacterium]|nr:cupin domain-containing protein [Chloroflexota bacterium]
MTGIPPTTGRASANDDDATGVVARGAPTAAPDVDTPGYRIKWLFSGQIAPDAEQTLGYVVIQPGQKNPLHAHPNCEELLYLLSGQLDHSLEDRVFRLNPGDAIRVPAGVKHDARCVGEEPATMIVCYSAGQREMQAYE